MTSIIEDTGTAQPRQQARRRKPPRRPASPNVRATSRPPKPRRAERPALPQFLATLGALGVAEDGESHEVFRYRGEFGIPFLGVHAFQDVTRLARLFTNGRSRASPWVSQ